MNSREFPSVIGQENAKRSLLKAINEDRMAHAYLFVGPAGCGKRALAIELARVLNCPSGIESTLSGCDCPSCRQMMTWRHPNLLPVIPLPRGKNDTEEKSLELSKDAIDEQFRILDLLATSPYSNITFVGTGQVLIKMVRIAKHFVSLAPVQFGYRVLIIFPADKIREEAANATLKLLEEPPERCILILLTDNLRDVMPTILSRCQMIRLQPLTRGEIFSQIQKGNRLTAEEASDIANLADGNLSRALSLKDVSVREIANDSLDLLRSIAIGNVDHFVITIDNWVREKSHRSDIYDRLDLLKRWLTDAIAYAGTGGSYDVSRYFYPYGTDSIARIGTRYGVERLQNAIVEVEEAKLAIDSNSLKDLALAGMAIKLKRILND